jgi:hypothetical protein
MKPARTDPFTSARSKKPIPFDFVLDLLDTQALETRPMFGSVAVYLGERVVFILREKGDSDDGVWVAYEPAREEELLRAIPALAPITRLPSVRCWKKLAAASETFEEDVALACRLARDETGPLGKIPQRQAAKARRASSAEVPAQKRPRVAKSAKARAGKATTSGGGANKKRS